MAKRAKKTFSLDLPPLVTGVALVATILFMVLGWYSEPSHILKFVVAVAVAVITMLGIIGKRFHKGFEIGFGRVLKLYNKAASWFVAHKITSFATVAASVAVLVWLMDRTPTTLVPNEDTGVLFCMVDMPPGTSQERTMEVLDKVDMILAGIPEIEYRMKIAGYSFMAGQGATYGTFIIKLKNWEERKEADQMSNAI
ncbi:MAG: efflux RND transporter permease subunit, partial [Muribaculaceae bacterium]|nr:efflux RND transporter permease subunit [Muribaculaceae bacterium]